MKYSEYLIFSLLIYMDLFFGVTSKSITNNDSPKTKEETFYVCQTLQFLSNSNYTKSCVNEPETLLCEVLHDLSLKWCLKGSQNFKLPVIENVTLFDSLVLRFESLDNVRKFCETPKNFPNASSDMSKFYSDTFTCTQNCLDPLEANKKPKKICYALAWLEAALNSPDEIMGTSLVDPKLKPKTGNETLVQKAKEKNVGVKTEGENKTILNITETPNSAKNTLESANKPADVEKTQSLPVNVEQEKENILETPTKLDKVLESKKIDHVNSDSKNEQTLSKVDQTSLADHSNDQNGISTQMKSLKTVVNESKDIKPDMDKKPENSVLKIDKQTDPNTEKTEKVHKIEENKSSTLSDNTNDIIENQDILNEDGEAPPLSNIEDDQAGDIGLLNPDAEFPNERKMLPHFPGREENEETHLFLYFVILSLFVVFGYIGYHNKKKILAMVLEGRRSRNSRGRRRPSTANYRKLDCNLEEAVTSQCNSNVTHVIY